MVLTTKCRTPLFRPSAGSRRPLCFGGACVHTLPRRGKAHPRGRLIQGPGGWGCYLPCPGGGLGHVPGVLKSLAAQRQDSAPAASCWLPCTSSNLPEWPGRGQSTGSDPDLPASEGSQWLPWPPLLQPTWGPREPLLSSNPCPTTEAGNQGLASLTWEGRQGLPGL